MPGNKTFVNCWMFADGNNVCFVSALRGVTALFRQCNFITYKIARIPRVRI
jgi:hypothetical protein